MVAHQRGGEVAFPRAADGKDTLRLSSVPCPRYEALKEHCSDAKVVGLFVVEERVPRYHEGMSWPRNFAHCPWSVLSGQVQRCADERAENSLGDA